VLLDLVLFAVGLLDTLVWVLFIGVCTSLVDELAFVELVVGVCVTFCCIMVELLVVLVAATVPEKITASVNAKAIVKNFCFIIYLLLVVFIHEVELNYY
jgi:hypothetical protein